MTSIWIVYPGQDEFTHEAVPTGSDIKPVMGRYLSFDDGEFITAKCRTDPDLQTVVIGKPCGKNDTPNNHCDLFTGVIVLCWLDTDPIETREQGRQRVVTALQGLSEISVDTENVTQSVWIYAADQTIPPTRRQLSRNDGTIVEQCIALMGSKDTDKDGQQVWVDIEHTTSTPMLLFGTTQNHDDMAENQWARGLYGPVVLTGGTMNPDTSHVQFEPLSDTIAGAYMAQLVSHPIDLTRMALKPSDA